MMAIAHQDDSVASQLSDTRSVGAAQLYRPQLPLHRAQLGLDLGSLQLANPNVQYTQGDISQRQILYHLIIYIYCI
jgi:hypothetical protein